jgi:transcriptional regulator with XRE-family HTH domain
MDILYDILIVQGNFRAGLTMPKPYNGPLLTCLLNNSFSSIRELAEATGIFHATLSQINKGTRKLFAYGADGGLSSTAKRLSDALGTIPEEFYHENRMYHSDLFKADPDPHRYHYTTPDWYVLTELALDTPNNENAICQLMSNSALIPSIKRHENWSLSNKQKEKAAQYSEMAVMHHIRGLSLKDAASLVGFTANMCYWREMARTILTAAYQHEKGDFADPFDFFDYMVPSLNQ